MKDKDNQLRRIKKKDKAWRKQRDSKRETRKTDHHKISDAELLKIQGLVRCKACDGIHPIDFPICPTCGGV